MARNGFGFQLLLRFLAKLELLFEVEQYFEAKGRWRNGDDVSMEWERESLQKKPKWILQLCPYYRN